jgi:aspartyl protease family protein
VSDNGPSMVFYILAIVLVASSLVGMRLPIAKAAKMLLAWLAIFGVAFVLFSFRSEFSAVGQRLYASAFGTPVESGGELRISMAEDGHFWVRGSLNGESVRFLVDSGASVTTVSAETARNAGIVPTSRKSVVNTANGRVIMSRAYADRLEVGSIERREFPIDINEGDDTNILGMNFLSSLSGWRVERGDLVLRP